MRSEALSAVIAVPSSAAWLGDDPDVDAVHASPTALIGKLAVACTITVGGCVAATWLAFAIAPLGFCVALYDPPAMDFTVTLPLLEREPAWCAQDVLPATAAGADPASTTSARLTPILRPD